MEPSLSSTIEKLRALDAEEEAKLKEMRDYESRVCGAERGLREERAATERALQQLQVAARAGGTARARAVVARIRSRARAAVLASAKTAAEDLRARVESGVRGVWRRRVELGAAAQSLSEQCGVPALLATRAHPELPPRPSPAAMFAVPAPGAAVERLRAAVQRRNLQLAERERLRLAPDHGEEFIRRCRPGSRLHYRNLATKIEENVNDPIKFSTSPAAKRRVIAPVRAKLTPMPWYQPWSVCGSMAALLIYFCILREENDIDQELGKSLYDRINGLEKHQLLMSYRFNKENGRPVEDIERRLRELTEAEAAAAAPA